MNTLNKWGISLLHRFGHPTPLSFLVASSIIALLLFFLVTRFEESRVSRIERTQLVQDLVTLIVEFERQNGITLKAALENASEVREIEPRLQLAMRTNIERQLKIADRLAPHVRDARSERLKEYKEALLKIDQELARMEAEEAAEGFWMSMDEVLSKGGTLSMDFHRRSL